MSPPRPAPSAPSPPASPRRLLGLLLAIGVVTMAVEMTTSRLMAPFFGTTLIAWTAIIGSVMVALALGSWWGGRGAARAAARGEDAILELMTAGGLLFMAVPVAAGPLLAGMVELQGLGALVLGLGGVVTMVALPVAILGMATPRAIHLLAAGGGAGQAAGRVYAAGALGGILGTLLPGLVLVPVLGSKPTMLLAGAALVATAALARRRPGRAALALAAAGLLGLGLGPLKPAPGLLHAEESLYNYIQVFDDGLLDARLFGGSLFPESLLRHPRWGPRQASRRFLVLNEGFAYHSVYAPDAPFAPLTGTYFDGLALLPLLVDAGRPLRAAAIGLGAGTAPDLWVTLFGRDPGIQVDGVEIDPRILEAGRRYFGLGRAEASGHLRCYAEDGRVFLLRRPEVRYDLIALDVFKQPYIPFHLASREYFRLLERALAPGGVVAMNLVVTHTDSDLFVSLLSAIRDVFPQLSVLGGPSTEIGEGENCLLLASREPLRLERLRPEGSPSLRRLMARPEGAGMAALCQEAPGRLRAFTGWNPARSLTDDHSAIEYYSQKMMLEAAARLAQRGLPPPPGAPAP